MFAYILPPTIFMRAQASKESKVVSEALFAEPVQIINSQKEWMLISTADGYQGFIPNEALVTRASPYTPSTYISRIKAHLYENQDIEYGPLLSLPYGVHLETSPCEDVRWTKVHLPDSRSLFIQSGDLSSFSYLDSKALLPEFSMQFLNLPYTWGGRSSFGYDCSGFVQMLYSKIKVDLPRDAYMQCEDNKLKEVSLNSLELGDLIFFGNERITHVGLYIGGHKFIHATAREYKPWIRISSLLDDYWNGSETSPFSKVLYKALL